VVRRSTPDKIAFLQQALGNRRVSQLLGAPDTRPEAGEYVTPVRVDRPGRPLDQPVRAEMESRFQHDLSQVRVHADAGAAASAAELDARAYTLGHHIVFGAGQYAPEGERGRRLLAHELAHVLQQRQGGAPPQPGYSAAHEVDARRAAASTVAGDGPVMIGTRTGVGIACATDDELVQAVDKHLVEVEGPSGPEGPAHVGRQPGLSPTELIDEHVFSPRVLDEVGRLERNLAEQERLLAQNPSDKPLASRVADLRARVYPLAGRGLSAADPTLTVPGHGRVNTTAVIQLVDDDGHLIALERGVWGPDRHAEVDALRKLRARLGPPGPDGPRLPPGTRMNVAGNQYVCSEVCLPEIASFAHDYGISPQGIDGSVRVRPKMAGSGLASPKTTERTALRSDVPQGEVRTEPLFPSGFSPGSPGAVGGSGPAKPGSGPPKPGPGGVAGAPGTPGEPSSARTARPRGAAGRSSTPPVTPDVLETEVTGVRPRTGRPHIHLEPDLEAPRGPRGLGLRSGPSQLTMTAVHLGISVGGDLLTSWLLDRLAQSMAEMPPLTVERAELWARDGVRTGSVLDLVAAELPREVQDLKERRQALSQGLLFFWAQLGQAPAEARESLIEAAVRQLLEDRRQLRVAANNVATALESEQRFAESAQAAEDLGRIISNPGIWEGIVTYGRLSVDQVEQVRINLSWYQASIRRAVLAPLHELDGILREAVNVDNMVILQLRRAQPQATGPGPAGAAGVNPGDAGVTSP
jgi:hypothetical protein